MMHDVMSILATGGSVLDTNRMFTHRHANVRNYDENRHARAPNFFLPINVLLVERSECMYVTKFRLTQRKPQERNEKRKWNE